MIQTTATAPQDSRHAHLGMLLWALIVGSSFPAVGLMSDGLPPLLLTALRFAIAALALLPLVWRGPESLPSVKSVALYAVMGLCLAGFFGAMFWAAHRTTALSMAALYVTVPLLAYGLGRGLGVEPPAFRLLLILLLGAAGALGLAWAQSGGQLDAMQLGFAEAIYFLGCISSALYPVLSKWGLKRGLLSTRAESRTFWSLLIGGALIGLLGLAIEAPGTLARLTLSDTLVLLYLAIFSSGVTFWLMQRATAVLTPGAVTGYSYLAPFISMLLLFVQQPEQIGWQWLPGSLMVLVATALLLRPEAPRRLSRLSHQQ